jgi:hypothetical protein
MADNSNNNANSNKQQPPALRQGKSPNANLSAADASDPFLYAGILTSLFGAGALQNLLGPDLLRWLDMMIHARRNRQHAQTRIAQLQGQVSKVENFIAQSQSKTTGHQLDKFR